MGSRIRNNVNRIFECFCEIISPNKENTKPWILQKFPEHYRKEEMLNIVPDFAYPCDFAFPCDFDKSRIYHHSFVLTNVESKWTFGFCRLDLKSETTLVILSDLPWHKFFYKLLDAVSKVINCNKPNDLWSFLEFVYNSKLPIKGCDLKVYNDNGDELFNYESPVQFQLPNVKNNINLAEYYSSVSSESMIIIFASILCERRIIFTSKKLCKLSACVQAANAILYPMNWQHIFIPVLPQALIDYLSAPMPYLIGLPFCLFQSFHRNDLGEVVILNVDNPNNTVETPFDDVESLPKKVVENLKQRLCEESLEDGISKAFLRTLVQLIGGYRDALKCPEGERITFNKDAFIESRSSSMQPFLRKMLELQIFQQFIEERLEMLNNGQGFSDEFEMEVEKYNQHDESNRIKQQYDKWLSSGTAIYKSVKSVANPVVKNAVKTVKEHGKGVRSVYKEIRSRVYTQNKNRRTKMNSQSNSAPNSPSLQRKQPKMHPAVFPIASASYRKETLNGKQNLLIDPPSSPPPQLNMNLMEDLKDVIFKNISKNSTTSSLMDFDTAASEPNWRSSISSDFLADGDIYNTSFRSSVVDSPMETKDLIRLDSSSSIDDFDPLKNPDENNGLTPGVGLSNPLYQYFVPFSKIQSETKNNNDLLNEYGLNFDLLSLSNQPGPSNQNKPPLPPKPPHFKSNWTKFE